jgi:dodecin
VALLGAAGVSCGKIERSLPPPPVVATGPWYSGEGDPMSDHVYKTIELVGSSTVGVEDAVRTAVAKADKTVRNLRWFEVVETRGDIADGQVAHWQVTLKVGFTLEEGS